MGCVGAISVVRNQWPMQRSVTCGCWREGAVVKILTVSVLSLIWKFAVLLRQIAGLPTVQIAKNQLQIVPITGFAQRLGKILNDYLILRLISF